MEISRPDLRETSQNESHRRGLRPAHPGSLCGKNPPAPARHFFLPAGADGFLKWLGFPVPLQCWLVTGSVPMSKVSR